MNATDLPARPDIAPAPKQKRSVWVIIASVVGGLIVLGAISSALDTSETTAPNPMTITDPVIDSPSSIQEAMADASPLLEEGARELEQITQTSAGSSDAIHLNRAAELLDQAAALFVGIDDQMAGYLTSAADHEYAAADAAAVEDWDTMNRELEAATNDINAAIAIT